MMISTRGRYALAVLIDLASNGTETYIPLKDIVMRQQISQKYVESIMTVFSKAGLVDAIHGKGGGYRLNRSPDAYSVGEILRLTESNLVPVSCLEKDAIPCQRASSCKTLPVWSQLNNVVNDYLDSVSLSSLL